MFGSVDIWKMLAGVVIFLLGTTWMEESLTRLAGRSFKLFLKKQTANPFKAMGGGALVTALLQSSSVTGLMVLAFAGAGIIRMQQAMAIMLGANLGTTVTGWMVATGGFAMNLEVFALPLAGTAGLLFLLATPDSKWKKSAQFVLGFSFLFIGLAYIRTGMEGWVTQLDPARFAQAPLILFFLAGFVITALIQSSSATMAISLSALYAGALTFQDAAGLVLGSELGTTMKLFLAALQGAAVKRRLALGNFLINTVTVGLVLALLGPLIHLIRENAGVKNELFALVFFQSLINVLSIVIFFPFLGRLGKFLEKRFLSGEEDTLFIHKVSPEIPDGALDAMEQESRSFFHKVLAYAMDCFDKEDGIRKQLNEGDSFFRKPVAEKYGHIKMLHGEIHAFYIRISKANGGKNEKEKADRLMSAVRNLMYAAKNIKDAVPDMEQLKNSSNDVKYGFYEKTRGELEKICQVLHQLEESEPDARFSGLTHLYQQVTNGYTQSLKELYLDTTSGYVDETEITTLLNYNRELYSAYKSLIFGVKDLLFDREQSRYFDELPGFIR